MDAIRLHLIPFSTNVERVTLACAMKGIEVERIEHDPGDRSGLVRLSGQPLVPVAEIGGEVVADSVRILERLERLRPDPPLYPSDPARRATAETFIEWFDRVWKVPPNELDSDPAPADPRPALERIERWSERFERWLAERAFLLGDQPTVADVVAYPFLRYALHEPDPADSERFHSILRRALAPGPHPRMDDWIRRLDAIADPPA